MRLVHSRYGDRVDVTAAELVLDELIGNVVRYAPGQARVRADFDERGVTIAVADRGPGFSAPLVTVERNLLSESGRGLAIIGLWPNALKSNAKRHRLLRPRAAWGSAAEASARR